MKKTQAAIRRLKAECEEIYAKSQEPFLWRGQVWPSIMHACIATDCCGSVAQDEVRKLPGIREARECAEHLLGLRGHYFSSRSGALYEKQQLFELRTVLVEWHVQHRSKTMRAAE